jgi:hypothetical protein
MRLSIVQMRPQMFVCVPEIKGGNMKRYVLFFMVLIGGICQAQVLDKVNDVQYAVGAYTTTRVEQQLIISQAEREIANAQEYCQRTYIEPQKKAIADAQEILDQMDEIDRTK